MSESDTMFNERDRRCAAVQPMLSTDPSYDNRTIASTLGTRCRPTSPKRPRLGFRRSATTLYPSLTAPSSPDLNLLDYFVWSYVENITNITSHNTKASLITAIRRVFAELPPALVEKACSQFRIRIEAVIEAKGFYDIIKLAELIFSIKVLKQSSSVVFFRTTIYRSTQYLPIVNVCSYLSIYLSIYLSRSLHIYSISVHLSIYLSIYLTMFISVNDIKHCLFINIANYPININTHAHTHTHTQIDI